MVRGKLSRIHPGERHVEVQAMSQNGCQRLPQLVGYEKEPSERLVVQLKALMRYIL